MCKCYYIIFFILLSIGTRLDSQVQPSPIDRVDTYENIWNKGYNLKVLDSLIVGIGTARRTGYTQGMHISSYNIDGKIMNSLFSYDTLNLYSISPSNIHDIIDLGDNKIFTCTHGGSEICYAYDVTNQSFISVDTIANNYGHDFWFVGAIKSFNEDIYVLSNVSENNSRQIGVLKYSKDTVTYDVFGELDTHWSSMELIVYGEDNWIVTAWKSDEETHIFKKSGGLVEKVGILSEELNTGPPRSALLIDDKIIHSSNVYNPANGIPSWAIACADTLGNTIWYLDLKDYINTEFDPIILSARTRIPTLINAIDNDGVIFVGYEYDRVDTMRTGYGIVGKISYDGDIEWLRKYRHFTDNGFENRLYDIDYDAYNGYVVLGTIESNALEPFSSATWLMRLDNEGNLIDTTTSTIEVSSIIESVDVYPNPSGENISFNTDRLVNKSNFPVLLFSREGSSLGAHYINDNVLSIRHLPKGIYYFKYEIDGLFYRGNFVKQ